MNGIKHLPARFTPADRAGRCAMRRAGRRPGTSTPGRSRPTTATPQRPAGARHADARAVRLQLRHRRGGRRRPRERRRPRFRRRRGAPRRGTSTTCPPTASSRSPPPPTTAPRRTTRCASRQWITAEVARPDRRAVQRLRLRQPRVGAHLPGLPRLVDTRLAELGATRLHHRGEGDAADDFDGQLEQWDDALWPDSATGSASTSAPRHGCHGPAVPRGVPAGHRPSPFVASLGARPCASFQPRADHDGPGPPAASPPRRARAARRRRLRRR